MPPLANPNDLPTLLSRFHTWAEKQPEPGNGNGHGDSGAAVDGVREITYEEVLEHHRKRQPAQRERRTTPTRAHTAAEAASAQPEATIPGLLDPPVAIIAEKPQLPTQPALVETRTPAEEPIASRQAAQPAAPKTRSNPAARASAPAPAPAKKAATVPYVAKPPRKVAPAAAKPKAAITKKAAPAGNARKLKAVAAPPPAKKASATATRKPLRKHPEFRQVLAKTVRSTKKSPPAKNTKTPDRTRRITTRFSTAEERRIEKAATLAGMTVSAYLRKCALSAEQAQALTPPPRTSAKKSRKSSAAVELEPEMRLFAQPPATSLVGGWLSLLRQRFLSSPTRFSERA